MTIEAALLISFVSVAFGIFSGIVNLKRNQSNDDRRDASEMTTVIIKLENIQSDTGEIKADLKDVKADVKKNTADITRIDESLKSAWKVINHLQDKEA